MADKCVVCGEAVEGKPLYKKLGAGEHNVEVIAALRALQLITLPDSAKNTSYICWDCDEAVVIEYGRHLDELGQHKTVKQPKKQPKPRPKKKKSEMKMKVKVASSPAAVDQEGFWVVQQVNPPPPPSEKKLKQKQKQQGVKSQGRSSSDSNSHHSTHCLMCDNSFDNQSRGFQRHPLKKAVNDDMDVAQVMEDLGLARHIEPKMKARRFICNPCYIIIRRNCKNKLLKGTSIEGPPATPLTPHQDPIHRATTEEHAAEIARLLPPDLVECYKILTSKPSARPDATNAKIADNKEGRESHSTPLKGDSKLQTTPPRAGNISKFSPHTGMKKNVATPPMAGKKSQTTSKNKPSLSRRGHTWYGESSENTDGEEEEDGGLNLSQDEHGNYFIDVMSPSDEADNSKTAAAGRELQPTSHTPRKKKNVLLPKRFHHHLSGNGMDVQSSPSTPSDGTDGGTPGREGTKGSPSPTGKQEGLDARTCNICGISFSGKTPDWWHTLTSQLMGFDSITINMALKVLETQLAHTSEVVRTAQQVCLPCYSMVSAGFRSQVVQRFARQKNLSAAQVDLSRVKVRMLPKEALGSSLDGQTKRIEQPVSAKDMNGSKKHPVATNEILNGSNQHLHDGLKYRSLVEERYHKRNSRKGQKRKRSAKDETPGRKKRGIAKSSVGSISASSTLREEPPMRPGKVHPIMRGELQPRKYKSKIKDRRRVNRLRKHNTRLTKTLHTLGIARKKGRPRKVRVPQQVTGAPQELPIKRPRGRPPKDRSLEEGVYKHVAGEEVMPEKAQTTEEVRGEATCKPVVMLKDLKFVLPREAFGGKAVSALKVEGNMTEKQLTYPSQQSALATATRNCSDAFLDPVHFDSGANSTPLQCIFNLLSTNHPPGAEVDSNALPSQITEAVGTAVKGVEVCGQCVVCGCNYMMNHNLWHHLDNYINPPTLMVSTQWVCVSLSIHPAHMPDKEREVGKVCHQCFRELGQKFQQFVKNKVGESCGLSAEEVDLSEYLITFNPKTFNLEADPKQQSYIHEFEDGGQLLQRILPVMQQFSVDEVVGQGLRQPLQPHQYSVWLLLVLNELRVQVGADLGELGNWLVSLMPIQMYDSNLRPCPTALAAFLLKVTRSPGTMSEEELCGPIPNTVFMVEAPGKVANPILLPTLETPTSRDLRGDALPEEEDVSDKEDLPWLKFLELINLDSLINGTAKPIPAHCMTQGLMYAISQVSRLLAEGDQLLVDWVKQLSPIPLSDNQLESLVTVIGSLQSHLESHPEDVHQFEYEIIPLLNSTSTEASTKTYNFRSARQTHGVSTKMYSDLGEGSGASMVKRRASLSLSGEEEWRPRRKRMRGNKSVNSRARERRITSAHKPTKSWSDSQEDKSLPPTSDPSTTIFPTLLNPTTTTNPFSHSTPLYNSPTTTQASLKHSSPTITTPPLMTLTHSPVTITEAYAHSCSTTMQETMPDRPTSTSTNLKSPNHSPTLQIQAIQSYKVTPSLSEGEDSSHNNTLPEGKLVSYSDDIEVSLKRATHTDTNPQLSPEEHNLVYKDDSIGEEDTTKSLITSPSPAKDEMLGQAGGLKEPLLQGTVNKNNCNQSENHESKEKRDSEQTKAVKKQNTESAEHPTRQHEEMAKDNLTLADYERESEAVQVSSKLFNKVRELESQLAEIKRDNQKLQEDNKKLSSIQSSKEISVGQDQQTNKAIQQIKGHLKDLMCKTEKSQGLSKTSTLSSHPTLPSSKHCTMPKHQHTKKSKHKKKLDKNPEYEKERRDHQHPAETCTKNPGFDEHQTIDSIRPTKVSPSPHTQVQPPNLNSLQLKLKHKDEQTDRTSARKSTESKIIIDNHKTSTHSHLRSSSRRNSLSSNTKEITMHKSSILESSSHHDEKPCEQKDAGASDMKINENVSLHDSRKRIEAKLQVKSPSMEVKLLQEDNPVQPVGNFGLQADKQVNQIHILGCKNQGTQKTQEPVDKKPKLSFEELMNYDIKIRAPK